MKKTLTERINIPVSKKMLKSVDDYQFDNRIRTRSEAIRQLIGKGLKNE